MMSESARVRVGASAVANDSTLTALACDPSVTVRASLALNPSAPAAADAILARDPDERVRALLARKLATLVPSLSATDRDALREQTWTLLNQLAADEAERVRGAIAAEVKALPDAPRSLILQLANDPVVTVCEPVILLSPLLRAEDLVALVVHAPSAATRSVVARRSDLPETVADAIAASADEGAIRALLANQSAQIREATLDLLVEQAASHESWHDPLVRRPVLTLRVARILSEIVSSHLLEVLATRADVPDEFRQRLRARLANPALAAPPAAARPDRIEEKLMVAARAGDQDTAMGLLAGQAGVERAVVERAATLRSTKGLVALTWKAGLPMPVAVAMQSLLARVPPGAVLRPGPGGSFPLTVEEMKWQLGFLTMADAVETTGQAWFSGGSGSRVPTR
jgi:uncharacterized protein (DUF2336 family)